MRAILDGDIIVAKAVVPLGVDIGPVPMDVDLKRLRYNHTVPEVVDLMDLSEIYVEHRSGGFILHAIPSHPVTGKTYTLITMTYLDRKNLIQENDGTIRLLTPAEVIARDQAKLDDMADNQNLKAQARDIIANLTYDQILIHIDNVFSMLDVAQRTSLKKLYCTVLYLAKKAIR